MHVNEVTAYRCYNCGRTVCNYQIQKDGSCPYCGGCHFRGNSPSIVEEVWIITKFLLWREISKWKSELQKRITKCQKERKS